MEKLRVRLQKIANWLNLHRREVIGVVCVLVLVIVVTPVLAGGTPSGNPDGKIDFASQIALWIATLFAWIAQHVVKMIVIIIDLVVVPIMRYNNFVSSPVVGQGWAVVRDLVNMFFVVILLLIAFQTIFGVGRADWKRQVPRLLIMAVVINFSRTIAGILIDFGQVVMFTFVNAIADVAGGNFIQLFGLDKLFSYSNDAIARAAQNGVGFEAFDFFGAAFLTMILTFVILATMIILAALLAFRIVVLWCLIIVAPLTFFLGGAKGVIGGAEGYYADWWKRFTSAVSLGPILSFFVWLSLAAASSGNLAEKQGFDVQTDNAEAASIGGEITKAFDAPHMTSLIIAVALLFAGFEVSQQTAGSIGGRAGAMAASGVKGIPGLARSLAKVGVPVGAAAGAMALAPAATLAAGGIGLVGAKQWGRAGGKGITETGKLSSVFNIGSTAWREDVIKKVGGGLRGFGGALASTRAPIISSMGRRVQGLGFKTLQAQNLHKEHEVTETVKAQAGMSFENKAILASNRVNGFVSEADKLKTEVAAATLPQNKKHWEKVDDDILKNTMHAMHEIGSDLPDKEKDKHGSSTLVAFPKAASFDPDEETREDKKAAIVRQLGTVADKNESIRQIQVQNFEGENSDIFIEALKEVKDKNGRSIYSKMEDGTASDPMVKKWFKDNDTKLVGESRTNLNRATHDVAGARMADSRASTPETSAALTAAIATLATAVKGISVNDIKKGVVTPAMMTPSFAEAFGKHAKPEVFGAMDAGLKEPFKAALDNRDVKIEAGSGTVEEKRTAKASVDEARTRAGQGPGDYDRVGQKFTSTDVTRDIAGNSVAGQRGEREKVVNQMVLSNPQILEQLTQALGDFKGELAESIAEGIKMGGRDAAGNPANDDGTAVMNKLLAELKKQRSSFPEGNLGDLEYRRTQDVATTAINNLARILKDTNGATGRNTDAIARVVHMRQRAGV